MKISKKQLRQIIDEEIQKVVLLETLKINNKRGLTQAMILENLREDIKLLSELEIASAPRKIVSIITKALLDGFKLSVSGNLRLGSLISNVIAFINKHFSSVTEATGKNSHQFVRGCL